MTIDFAELTITVSPAFVLKILLRLIAMLFRFFKRRK